MSVTNASSKALAGQIDQVTENIENEVLKRYGQGAEAPQASLCCPTEYDRSVLEVLPREIVEKDYGCGDPSKYVSEGETVLDLGSGGGKICYILSQKVGSGGRVIGVDFNDKMLNLARKYREEMADKIGYANVDFLKGKIQDLALPLDTVEQWLKENPLGSVEQVAEYEDYCDRLRTDAPLVADSNVDLIVSNCVLNLVRPRDKRQLFKEMFRVLKRGGRAVISDIVCDEPPTEAILADPELWSGCIAGAFLEEEFVEMFAEAGFYGMEILERQAEPWQVIDGIEFRSLTVRAFKGKEGPCLEGRQAVVYKGPWNSVTDDDGHTFTRGERNAVCDKTYKILTSPEGPYCKDVLGLEPYEPVNLDDAEPFNCKGHTIRNPRETKGKDYRATQASGEENCCGPDCC
jgi:SAM-dependent methyltransferase